MPLKAFQVKSNMVSIVSSATIDLEVRFCILYKALFYNNI